MLKIKFRRVSETSLVVRRMINVIVHAALIVDYGRHNNINTGFLNALCMKLTFV